MIDNLYRDHKLGLVFETRVGRGRLLVCACDLSKLADHPQARQLLSSLLSYAASDRFQPSSELPAACLQGIFAPSTAKDKTLGR